MIDPHTAVGIAAARKVEREAGVPMITLSTAHPAKFESVVEPIIGAPVPVPASLQALLARPARAETLNADYAHFRARLLASR